MQIKFVTVKDTEFSDVFTIVKTALFEYVKAVFGWDDEFQKHRLRHDYDIHWYHWLYLNDKRIGLVCFKCAQNELHLHLLILLPNFQGKGLGTLVMMQLQEMAKIKACQQITLSSFKLNKKALLFYENLGYQRVKIESDFYTMQSPRLNE